MKKSDLADGADRLESLNRQCIELSYERAIPRDSIALKEYFEEQFRVCHEAFTLWNDIKLHLAELSSLKISDETTKSILKEVRSGEELHVIRQHKNFESLLAKAEERGSEPGDILDDYLFEKHDDLLLGFHAWFDLSKFHERKMLIGCIIVQFHNNPAIDSYYAEISDAFAFGLFKSVVVMCRALLELSLYDELSKHQLLKQTNVAQIETGRSRELGLWRLINLASTHRLVSSAGQEEAHQVRTRANTVIHLQERRDYNVTEELALDVIRGTTFVIEDLLDS